MAALALLLVFLTTAASGMPLFVSLLMSASAGVLAVGDLALLKFVVQQFFGGMDLFSLMAIPFFTMAGSLMNASGLTDGLIELSRLLVGRFRGGLGYVNVVASILFAGVNGSAAADTSALGSILIPAMEKDGFDRVYAAGITAGSSLIGPIIPPSIFMIIYAAMTNTSVGALFVGGVIPGLILGLAFMAMNFFYSRRYHVPPDSSSCAMKGKLVVLRALPALVAPGIIMGGIVSGVVTPTESGVLAVFYILAVGLFLTGKLTWRAIWDSLLETIRLTSAVFMVMGAASAVSWVLKWERVPQRFGLLLMESGISSSPVLLLLTLSLITFLVGMFMEEVSALSVLTPIFFPLAKASGVDPLHFGIVMTLNITIALITPPMGACVYIAAAVGKVELDALFKSIWPFVGVALLVLLLIIFFPPLVTFLPEALGVV